VPVPMGTHRESLMTDRVSLTAHECPFPAHGALCFGPVQGGAPALYGV
jgi:hypothetical protein